MSNALKGGFKTSERVHRHTNLEHAADAVSSYCPVSVFHVSPTLLELQQPDRQADKQHVGAVR